MSNTGYIAYIDEAGDFGLRRVSPVDHRGASEWLMVSGVVVRASNERLVPRWVNEMRIAAKNTQSPDLHFRTLGDRQKKIICKSVAELDLRLFIAISNKQNMRQYRNGFAASVSNTKAWFYWWMCRLLLERITAFCAARNTQENTPNQKLRVEFSRRLDLRYSELTDYLTRIWAQGKQTYLNKRTLDWSVVDLNQFHAYDHCARAGLQLADVVASAFYQSVNRDNSARCNPEYAKMLAPRVWTVDGSWFDNGVKVFPVPLRYPGLEERQKEVFRFYGYPDGKW